MVPNDPDAIKKLRECEKAITKIKFEEAIAIKDEEIHSIAETLDYHTIGTLFVHVLDDFDRFVNLTKFSVILLAFICCVH